MGRLDRDQPEDVEAHGGAPADLSPVVSHAGFTVRRDHLLAKLGLGGREAGISVICAPRGFGKTALLLQYAAAIQGDPARGAVRLIDAEGLDVADLGRELRRAGEELDAAMHPLVAIDNAPAVEGETLDQLVALFRALREQGFELVITCDPGCVALRTALGDSFKIGARALAVQPREYSAWTRAFSISNALDVYELTQGVPALVVQLRQMTSSSVGAEGLERATAELYRQIVEPLKDVHDPLYRLMCIFLLMGKGSITDLERSGMRVRKELLSRVSSEYPVFGYNDEQRTFCCMASQSHHMARLRKDIAESRPAFLSKVMRTLMRAGRVDDAVRLAEQLLPTKTALEVIEQFPAKFALSGNALYVHQVASRLNGEDLIKASIGVVLAVFLAALTMGEYRLARAMCATLRQRASEIEGAIDARTWAEARALSEVWGSCSGLDLPVLSDEFESPDTGSVTLQLKAHRGIYRALLDGDGGSVSPLFPAQDEEPAANEIDVPGLLLSCDRVLDEALHHAETDASVRGKYLDELADTLSKRHLKPLAVRVRMVAATRKLLLGEPIADERAFIDAGTTAVRESDLPTQLFCLLGEGWQAFATNQVVTARFRAQQVLKLAEERQAFLCSWAKLLERAAFVVNTSQVGLREEAELLDLSQEQQTSAEAWAVALHLSAAHFDSELSAWYSLHKDALLDAVFCPMARLAMHAVGERAESLRKLLPRSVAARYLLGEELHETGEELFDTTLDLGFSSMGQVNMHLFGGFRVERNGHVLTDDIWRRKRASVLAARLALSLGSFVSRRTLAEELWPQAEFTRARENLYVTLSTLRTALGQQELGPQYVLTQGDCVALNTEFVASDTGRFDLLAREILLKRSGMSGRQIVEACLKMEQLYQGTLYAPDSCDIPFFQRMRGLYHTRFVDCMLRGIEVAIEGDDLHSASWLVEAALRNSPLREDVVRAAMRVYDLSGRRREVIELYSNHLHYVEHELQSLPDDETRRAYEEIVNRSKISGLM